MHAHVLLLAAALLLARSDQPRIDKALGGSLGVAQQASLNQIDILADLWRRLPPELRPLAGSGVAAAQKAHDTAVRDLIVVERGVVTADYRRWKLQRAIQALLRADRELDRTLGELARQAPADVAEMVHRTREQARSETTRAVGALRSLDGGSRWGGAGATSAASNRQISENKERGEVRVSKGENALPAAQQCNGR